MFLRALSVVFVFLFSFSSFAADVNTLDALKARKEKAEKRKSEIVSKVGQCEDPLPEKRGTWCKTEAGWKAVLLSEVNPLKDELKKLNADIQQLDKEINTETGAQSFAKLNPKVDFGQFKLEAKHLLLETSIVASEVGVAGNDVKAMMQQLDKTLLGTYTQYVVEQSLKSAAMKSQICAAVASCGDNKKIKAEMADMKTQIKTFEAWKEFELRNPTRNRQPELLKTNQ